VVEDWIREAKKSSRVGMILLHNGIVRKTSKGGEIVNGLIVKVDKKKIQDIEEKVKKEKGIFYCRIKVNEGKLQVGEDIMWVLIAGDFRENCFPVMEKTVGEVKEAISEKEV